MPLDPSSLTVFGVASAGELMHLQYNVVRNIHIEALDGTVNATVADPVAFHMQDGSEDIFRRNGQDLRLFFELGLRPGASPPRAVTVHDSRASVPPRRDSCACGARGKRRASGAR